MLVRIDSGAGFPASGLIFIVPGSLTSVFEANDSARIGLRRLQLESLIHPFWNHTLAAAQHYRVQEQMQLVDEIVLEHLVHELAAAVGENVFARLLLQLADRLYRIVANDDGVAPHRFVEGLRYDIVRRSVHQIAEEIAFWQRLERRSVQ